MILAITGATGFVGSAVLDAACERGIDLKALTRRDQEPRAGVEWVRGDLANRAALADLVRDADAVLHIAGVVNAPDAAGFFAGNVAGTHALVETMVGESSARLVVVSSLAAREPELSQYGNSKYQAERVVQNSGLDWTIIRPPAIYGPRDTEVFELFKAAQMGVVPMPPKDGRASVIHVSDLARLLLYAAPSQPQLSGAIFEPDDGVDQGWGHKDLAKAIGEAVGKSVFVPHIPGSIMRGAARLDGLVRRGKAKLTLDRALYMAHPDWVSSRERAVPNDLWKPEILTVDGLAQTAQWYRENGWLK